MGAPKGNKFAQGGPGGGRPGYEYEKEQLQRMRKLLSSTLTIAEKIKKGTAKPRQILAYERLERLTLKIMDKLHASKQEQTLIGGDLPFTIKVVQDAGNTTRTDSQVLPDSISSI